MQLRHALKAAIERLTSSQVPSPRLNAEILIMFTLGCDRAYLYAHPERELSRDEMARYDDGLARRATGVPAQYITGHQEFWGLDLVVSPAVLIPRPETEHVVEAVLERLKVTIATGRVPSPLQDSRCRHRLGSDCARISEGTSRCGNPCHGYFVGGAGSRARQRSAP